MKHWRGQPDHNYWTKLFTSKERAVAQWGIGVFALSLALAEWTSPTRPPFTGKWGWLLSWGYSTMGPNGTVYLYLGTASVLFLFGASSWLKYKRNSASGVQ
jgi:hypothetical protein